MSCLLIRVHCIDAVSAKDVHVDTTPGQFLVQSLNGIPQHGKAATLLLLLYKHASKTTDESPCNAPLSWTGSIEHCP